MKLIHVYITLFILTLGVSAVAQPDYMSYQGFLKDNNGDPLATGAYDIEFNIFDDPSSDSLIWGPFLFDGSEGEGHADTVSILNGRFNVILGPTDTAGRNLSDTFTGANTYIEISIDGGTPILPRQQVLSTPYAFEAKYAGTADQATSADTATTAGSAATATTADSATEITGTEWNAPADSRVSVSIDGVEALGIGAPAKGGNGALDVSVGHVFVDEGFGIFSTNASGGIEGGFDTDTDGDLILYSRGTSKIQLLSDRFQPTANGTSIQGGVGGGLYLGASNRRWKAVYSVTGSIQTSDRRLKTDIQDLEYGLNEVLAMRPTSYQWKDNPNGPQDLGLIAQELQEIVPEAVNVGDDEDQTLGIMYSDLIPVLIKAVQDQQELILQQDSQKQELENRIENLEAQLKAVTHLVETSLSAEGSAAMNR